MAVQDYVRMLCVEKVPPSAAAGIIGGQPGPQGLMPVGQDAFLVGGVEIVFNHTVSGLDEPQPPIELQFAFSPMMCQLPRSKEKWPPLVLGSA
jgi:hypothetical protein